MNKLVLTRGCTAFGMDYNDMSITDMKEEDVAVIYNKLINHLLNNEGLTYYHLIEAIVEQHGVYTYDSNTCEQCGDNVEYYELNIE